MSDSHFMMKNHGESTASIVSAALSAMVAAKAPRRTISSTAAAIIRARMTRSGGDDKAEARPLQSVLVTEEHDQVLGATEADRRCRLRERRRRARASKKERQAAAKKDVEMTVVDVAVPQQSPLPTGVKRGSASIASPEAPVQDQLMLEPAKGCGDQFGEIFSRMLVHSWLCHCNSLCRT